jgi:hypothetical protein
MQEDNGKASLNGGGVGASFGGCTFFDPHPIHRLRYCLRVEFDLVVIGVPLLLDRKAMS